jgi:hypothetical protein
VLHDIYSQMVADGLPAAEARALLRTELAVETNLLFPIRRNVARVAADDLIISDMYLPPEAISAFLFEICDLHTHRPIIRSNWGKHTGTIWPLVLAQYVVRRHVGDNPASDIAVPSRFGIACELVPDAAPSAWETKLQELGLGQLALVQREVRLRTTPPGAEAFHTAVVGPYLTILVCFAIHLVHRFGPDAEFAFVSRSSDELGRVFIGLFPEIRARGINLSRRLAGDEAVGKLIAADLTPATVVVDMVGTGRSFLKFAERNGDPGRTLMLFAFLDLLLDESQRERAGQRQAAGRFTYALKITAGGRSHWALEHLLQSHYPPVGGLALDPRSGGVVRIFGAPELDRTEAELVAWKSAAVTELVRTVRRRGLPDPGAAPATAAMEQAMRAVVADQAIMAPFSSFRAREKMDWG